MSYVKYFILSIVISISTPVCADTILNNTNFFSSDTLVAKKSPYTIKGTVVVHPGATLKIEKGVKLIFDQGSIFVRQGGHLKLHGTAESVIELHVQQEYFASIIQGDHSQIEILYTHIYSTKQPFLHAWNNSSISLSYISQDAFSDESSSYKQFISIFDYSSSTINNLELSNWQGVGLQVFGGSTIYLTDSVFEHNKKAVEIFDAKAYIERNDFEDNPLALERSTDQGDVLDIDARNNWWGSITGPLNTVIGDMLLAPWSPKPHKKKVLECCSNILFLPGLMGSRLYKDGGVFENQLWEPNRNADVKKLFMNIKGEGLDNSIYTRDVIDQTNIVGGVSVIEQNMYKDFNNSMQALVNQGIIRRWISSPYDWRFSPDTILANGIIQGTRVNHTTLSLIETLKELSKDSKTKKVTIVAHSNGGLVAKQLMIALKQAGLDTLVDKVVFVGMPEFGTPQAITGLLFGHDQAIANGLILKTSVAKKLAENMPTAYTLLPSAKYFASIDGFVRFASSTLGSTNDLFHAISVFPNTNANLFNAAESLHRSLDDWAPPAGTEVYQLIGTGLPTVSGVVSVEGKKDDVKFIPEYTTTGDGVVQVGKDRTGQVFTFDLQNSGYKHMTLMNYPKIIDSIKKLIRSTSTVSNVQQYSNELSAGTPVAANYKLIKISPANQSKNMTVQTNYTVDPNPNTGAAKYKYDKYSSGYSSYFDIVAEQSNMNRFELFGDDVQYLHMNDADTITIAAGDSSSFDLNLFTKSSDTLTQLSFENIKSIKGADVTIGGGQEVAVSIPLVNQTIKVNPTKEIVFDKTGRIVQKEVFATGTESIEQRVEYIKTKIQTSDITAYLKPRYLSMLNNYLKNKDNVYFQSIQQRINRAIASIDMFSNNIYLINRYKKLKQDYIYLGYVFSG